MVSYYRSAFGIRGSPSSQKLLQKFVLTSGYAGGFTILLLPQIKSRNQDFARRENACLSYKQIPRGSSVERVQAPDPGDTALSTPPVDDEFHPDVQTERRRMRGGARYSTASNPVCNLQGGNHHEGL